MCIRDRFYGVQNAIFQETVKPEYLGRVFSLLTSAASLAMPFGDVYKRQIPYSLHDMRVKKIIIQDKTIVLEFEDGYEKLTEPFEQVEGNITIEGCLLYTSRCV